MRGKMDKFRTFHSVYMDLNETMNIFNIGGF